MRMLSGSKRSVNRLYSIVGVDWLIAAGINFSSTTALRFADLEGLPLNNTLGPGDFVDPMLMDHTELALVETVKSM